MILKIHIPILLLLCLITFEVNAANDVWIQRANFLGPGRTNAIAFVLNNVAFVGSGYNGVFLDDVYAYRRVLETDNITQEPKINIYPNPSAEVIKVKTTLTNAHIELYALNGKKISNQVEIKVSGEGYIISRNQAPAGNYILKFTHPESNTTKTEKIVFI